MLDRQSILARAGRLPSEDVPCPEWGGAVRVRALTGRERDAYEMSLFVGEGKTRRYHPANGRARLVALCAVGEDGARLFSDADADALGECDAEVLDRLWDVARRLSGLREKDVEHAEKNSAPAPSGGSTSA